MANAAKTTFIQDEVTGTITVKNLLVNTETQERITVAFRSPSGADDAWMNALDVEDANADWMTLIRFCTQWDKEETPSLGYFLSSKMPFATLQFLRKVILPRLFRVCEYSEEQDNEG
jgi:hypothetical protein